MSKYKIELSMINNNYKKYFVKSEYIGKKDFTLKM